MSPSKCSKCPTALLNQPSTITKPESIAARQLPLSSFLLDLRAGELLTSDGQLAELRKQALDVLLVLGAHAGRVVGKDELMRIVWRDVVVGESSLAQAISDIRYVLGDHDHRLVRNVARRGYMLVPDPVPATVEVGPDESAHVVHAKVVDTTSVLTQLPFWRRRPSNALAALLLSIVALGGLAVLLKYEGQRGPASVKPDTAGS